MSENIDQVMRRTQRYFYTDGLAEMAVGGLFLGIGLLLVAFAAGRSLGTVLFAIGLPALTLGGAFLLKRIIQALKERTTYPRTGYVSYRSDRGARGRWFVVAAALGLAILIFFLPDDFSQMAIVQGALLGIVLFYLGYQVGLWRFYLLAAAAVLIGFLSTILFPGEILASAITFVATGALLILSGALVLINYLARNPKVEEQEE